MISTDISNTGNSNTSENLSQETLTPDASVIQNSTLKELGNKLKALDNKLYDALVEPGLTIAQKEALVTAYEQEAKQLADAEIHAGQNSVLAYEPAIEPSDINAGILEQNTDQVMGLVAMTQDQVDQVLDSSSAAKQPTVAVESSDEGKEIERLSNEFEKSIRLLVDEVDNYEVKIESLKNLIPEVRYNLLLERHKSFKKANDKMINFDFANNTINRFKEAIVIIGKVRSDIENDLNNVTNLEAQWKKEKIEEATKTTEGPEIITAPTPEVLGETPPPTPPFETPAANAGRNTVIRDIENQGMLRKKLREEALARGENPSDEQLKERAKHQAEFVKVARVEDFIVESDAIKKIFAPEGGNLNSAGLRQEMLKTLLDKSTIANERKLTKLARQLSNETGLSMEEAQQLINNQEQRLRDSALAEINAGRIAGASPETAAANAQTRSKTKLVLTVGKSIAYIGGGALLTAVTGGYGAIGILTGVRVFDRIITDRSQKRQVDAKFAEMKANLESNEAGRDGFLKEFFAETSVLQQTRISGERNFDFKGFASINADLLDGYNAEEQGEVMKALGALQEIDKINYGRENDLLERLANRLKKSNNPVSKLLDWAAMEFNKFMVKGGENTYERAVSAAMLGGAAIAAREMPFIRSIMLAMSGWKVGDVAGRKIWGAENPELVKIEDTESAQDILDALSVAQRHRDSDKQKRLLMKAGTSLLFATMPAIAGAAYEYYQNSMTAKPEGVTGSINEEEFRRAMARPTIAAGAVEAVKATVETPQANPFEEATKAMEAVHGNKAPHLWGLIGEKMSKMTDGLHEVPSVKELSESDGRMTYLIDSIKDKVAANPEEFGLAKGSNIDVLASADLEKLSQNSHFNEAIAGIFDKGSLTDQAQNLSDSAVKNIEANNAYYQDVASHLKSEVRLDQSAYDAMDRLHGQGLSAEAAAQALQNNPESYLTATSGNTSGIETATTFAPIESGTSPAVENIDVDRAATAGMAPDNLPVETAGILPAESFQDEITREKWSEVYKSMENRDRNQVSKSLEAIFQRTGLKDTYNAYGYPYFNIENISMKNGVLNFEVPSPSPDNEVIGNLKFSYNPGSKELSTGIGDTMEKIKDIKNIDDAIKTSFKKVADQLRWR